MLRISKLTDYGTTVMVQMAREPKQPHKAKEIAAKTHISLPTVSKLLKQLTRSGLLASQRGVNGGYTLAIPAENITVAKIIAILEGEIAVTECSHTPKTCSLESLCISRQGWRVINRVVRNTLENISLASMALPSGIEK
jgi:FeS assembly SUF system regulator